MVVETLENMTEALKIDCAEKCYKIVGSEASKMPLQAPERTFGTQDMALEEKFKIIRSIGEECINDEELMNLLKNKKEIIAYDGFEPSGRMHIAQGILRTINTNKLTSCGVTFIFWVADFFAQLNKKLDGNLDKIRTVGKYMIEIWKAVGMDVSRVQFLWSSDEMLRRNAEYMGLVFDIATKNSLTRVLRCTQIMGRSENDDLSAAQIMYPVFQCTDIFFLKADICQLGMDQRKVNMLAREYCDQIRRKFKPVVLSHPMLMGLKEGQAKMSKSDPDSAIFMEDSEADVNRKIKIAFCPEKIVENNPILDYVKHLIFGKYTYFKIERDLKNGGDVVYLSYEALECDFVDGSLHPGDLKSATAKALNLALQPVRDHFVQNTEAKKLLDSVKAFRITR